MKIVFCIIFMAIFLCASQLDDINITSSDKSVEVLLVLDSAFDGRVVRQDSASFGSLVLKDTKYNKNKVSTQTELFSKIEIFQQNNDVYIVFASDNFNLKFDVEVKSFNNILKILVTPKVGIASTLLKQDSLENAISAIKQQNTAPVEIESWRYILVVGILIALLVALVVAKRRMFKKNGNMEFSYFNKSSFKVLQTINIDMKNKIIVLDSSDAKYLLLIGQNGSFLIDKMPKNIHQDYNANEAVGRLLKQKEATLSYFLKAYEDASKKHI